jgi:hypothetical protein
VAPRLGDVGSPRAGQGMHATSSRKRSECLLAAAIIGDRARDDAIVLRIISERVI